MYSVIPKHHSLQFIYLGMFIYSNRKCNTRNDYEHMYVSKTVGHYQFFQNHNIAYSMNGGHNEYCEQQIPGNLYLSFHHDT